LATRSRRGQRRGRRAAPAVPRRAPPCPRTRGEVRNPMTDVEIQFEIPSVDHPVLAEAAIEEASRLGVPIARLSQGSGPRMLTDEELRRYLDCAHAHGIDCFMFVSSRNSFDPLPEPLAGDAVVGEEAFADA